jgi:hypothetical protein
MLKKKKRRKKKESIAEYNCMCEGERGGEGGGEEKNIQTIAPRVWRSVRWMHQTNTKYCVQV